MHWLLVGCSLHSLSQNSSCFITFLIKSISLHFLFRMVNGVVSFIRPPRSLLIFSPHFLLIEMVVSAQVIMLSGSLYYISLINRSRKNTGVTGTSKHHSFRKTKFKTRKGQTHAPLFCYEPLIWLSNRFSSINFLRKLPVNGFKNTIYLLY